MFMSGVFVHHLTLGLSLYLSTPGQIPVARWPMRPKSNNCPITFEGRDALICKDFVTFS